MTSTRMLDCSAAEVRRLLTHDKRQSRRLVLPQPPPYVRSAGMMSSPRPKNHGEWWWLDSLDMDDASVVEQPFRCPWGVPGDALPVAEEFKIGCWRDDGRIAVDYRASPEIVRTPWFNVDEHRHYGLVFESLSDLRASALTPDAGGNYRWEPGQAPTRWRPARTMPACLSRIVLRIATIRVEQLRALDETDARLEGEPDGAAAFVAAFLAQHGLPPEANPWVFVLKYEVEDVRSGCG